MPLCWNRVVESKVTYGDTALDFTPASDNECAGLVLLQNDAFQLRCEISLGVARLIRRSEGTDELLADRPIAGGRIRIGVEDYDQEYRFRLDGVEFGAPADGRVLSHEPAGSFTGAYLGMYASSNGEPSTTTADFAYFEYREL